MPLRPSRPVRLLAAAVLGSLAAGLAACGVDNSFDPVPPAGRTEIHGSLTVSTQEQVDNLRGIKAIEGDLRISGFEIANLDGMADLRRISGELRIIFCNRITDLAPLAGLDVLGSLDVRGCGRLRSLAALGGSRGMTQLDVSGCDSLAELARGDCLAELEACTLENLPQLASLEVLAQPYNLQRLTLRGLAPGLDYGPLAALSTLTELDLADLPIAALPSLSGHGFLKQIELRDMELLTDVSGLNGTPYLGIIQLWNCPLLTSLAGLEDLPELWSLRVDECAGLTSLAMGPGAGREDLGTLSVYRCDALTDLTGLAPNWTTLTISDCDGVTSLAGLAGDATDVMLNLIGLPGLEDLDSLPPGLVFRRFALSSCPNLASLAGLEIAADGQLDLYHLPALTGLAGLVLPADPHTVALSNLQVTDLGALAPVTSLADLRISGLPVADLAGLESLRTVRDRLSVQYNPDLVDASALAGVESVSVGSVDYWRGVFIQENPRLDTCLVEAMVAGWEVGGDVEISGNGPCAD